MAKRGQEIDGEFVVTQGSLDWVEVLENQRKAAPDDSSLLRMGYIGVKDRVNQALMVPVWVLKTVIVIIMGL